MEFYNRMKQKLAEEFDNDPPEFPEGNGSDDVESLKSEIAELKHHINSNYQVYVRRLEKRKTRIKELEEYILSIEDEKCILAKSAEEAEQYKTKLAECRDQLEQLEGFQHQELSKVKHMLLSAESALELERQKGNRRVECHNILVQTDEFDLGQVQQLSPDEVTQSLISQRDQLTLELNEERHVNQQLKQKTLSLCDELQSTKDQLTAVATERDSMRTTLLEAEIASHETNEIKADEVSSLKMEIAKLLGEKETLEVTLKVRDSEIRAKKEDIRKEKENYETALKLIESKELKLLSQEAEISTLKDTLSERLMQMRACQIENDRLSIEIESLQRVIDEKEKVVEKTSANYDEVSKNCDSLAMENSLLQQSVKELNGTISDYSAEVASLKTSLEAHSDELALCKKNLTDLHEDMLQLQRDKASLEKSIPGLIETSELVRDLRIKTNSLEVELEEKKQAIRHLQLRSNEMKKMLQRELKNETPDTVAPSAAPANGIAFNSTPPSASPTLSCRSREKETPSPQSSSSSGNLMITEVSIKYLRNVIFKFLTSPEDEAKQMTKAVATLLNFTTEEEKLLLEYLDWKTSWFGSKPKITFTP